MGPPGGDAKAHRTWDRGRRSCSSSSTPHHTTPHRTAPHRTAPHRTAPHHTTPHHTTPHHTLVTWHQSKNPQDGSCGTDCPHALPRSKSVVIRLDFSCVFPVSGRAHPARQPSRTPPWARHAVLWGTDAHTWPPPDRQTPTWRLPRQLCADMARAQWQGTIVAPRTYPCAVVARPSGQSAVVARPSGQSAAVAPPKQSVARSSGQSAIVALPSRDASPVAKRHRGAASVHVRHRGAADAQVCHCCASSRAMRHQHSRRAPPWCRQRPGTPSRRRLNTRALSWRRLSGRAQSLCRQHARAPSWRGFRCRAPPWRRPDPWNVCASLAMVFPPGQYSRHHCWVCTWRSANRNTSCRGALSSAVLTASRDFGGPHRLAQPPGAMAGHRRGAFAVDVRRRGATSRAEHHRSTAPTAKHQCAATTMAEHHRGAANSPVRRHSTTSGAVRHHGGAQTTVRQQGADARPAPTEPGGTQATGGARDRVT